MDPVHSPVHAAPGTPDVVLSFVHTMRQGATGRLWGLIANRRKLGDVRISGYGETCAFGMDCCTEYEKVCRTAREHPASHRGGIRFYDEPQPVRPTSFTRDRQDFPLAGSCRVVSCPSCSGGTNQCSGCGGSGMVNCSSCGGTGRSMASDGSACSGCGGSRRVRHGSCGGTGRVRCGRCSGEGMLVQYVAVVYEWYYARDDALVAHGDADRAAVKRKAREALARPGAHFPLESIAVAGVSRALGVSNEQIEAATRAGLDAYNGMLAKAAGREGTVLFQTTNRAVTPVSYLNARTGGRYGQFWAVGTRADHACIRPPLPLDPVKVCAWSAAALAAGLGIAALLAPELPAYTWASAAGLTALLATWGALRRSQSEHDRVVVVLGDDTPETSALFGLIPSALCDAGVAEAPDECYEVIYALASGGLARAGLSASCRLIVSLEGGRTEGIRLILVGAASLQAPTPALKGVLSAADVLLVRAAEGAPADVSALVTMCREGGALPVVRTIVTGAGAPSPCGEPLATTAKTAYAETVRFDLDRARTEFRNGALSEAIVSTIASFVAARAATPQQTGEPAK